MVNLDFQQKALSQKTLRNFGILIQIEVSLVYNFEKLPFSMNKVIPDTPVKTELIQVKNKKSYTALSASTKFKILDA